MSHSHFITNHLKEGFFIEAGAYDGEIYSNSLYYELKHGWTGLLVEPNPDALSDLVKSLPYIFLFNVF